MRQVDDFDLYEARFAETTLAGGDPCYFCGIGYKKEHGDLLCGPCSSRYRSTYSVHRMICARILARRTRFPETHESYWSPSQICAWCTRWTETKTQRDLHGR